MVADVEVVAAMAYRTSKSLNPQLYFISFDFTQLSTGISDPVCMNNIASFFLADFMVMMLLLFLLLLLSQVGTHVYVNKYPHRAKLGQRR